MTDSRVYTTNLSKAQGIIPETYELLEIWQPGMTIAGLKTKVRETGALGKPTQVRVDDVVGRGFAPRYLIEDGKPANWLKRLLTAGAPRGLLRQLLLVYTARANGVLHDFVSEIYWRKCSSKAGEVTKQDARDFLERAVVAGRIQPRWSDNMLERVARYLLGTLEDFELIEENRYGHRKIRPPAILPQTVVFLGYEFHFVGKDDSDIPRHPDWRLFGLMPVDVIGLLEKSASQGHLFLQNAGAILRMEWTYPNMESMLDAVAH